MKESFTISSEYFQPHARKKTAGIGPKKFWTTTASCEYSSAFRVPCLDEVHLLLSRTQRRHARASTHRCIVSTILRCGACCRVINDSLIAPSTSLAKPPVHTRVRIRASTRRCITNTILRRGTCRRFNNNFRHLIYSPRSTRCRHACTRLFNMKRCKRTWTVVVRALNLEGRAKQSLYYVI